MAFEPPEQFNIADYFLDARVREGKGDRPAVLTDAATFTYREIAALANQFGHALREAGVQPEQRVMIALPDGPAFVAALFGTLKIGAVVVMVNPQLKPDAIEYFYGYTRARVIVAHRDSVDAFRAAARGARHLLTTCVVGEREWDARLAQAPAALDTFPTHRDDVAIWLFSGGTTGQPKAVLQTHRSFANTTECYAKGVIGYTQRDVTLSVPKLYFGYATGSRSEEHTSELQSLAYLVCRLLLEKKKKKHSHHRDVCRHDAHPCRRGDGTRPCIDHLTTSGRA